MCVCVCGVWVCGCMGVCERGLPTWMSVPASLRQRQTTMARLAGCIPVIAAAAARWWVGWVCGGGGGASGPAIFLLSACQTKVREHIRGARLWSAEVGSLFMQAMGWKTSGFSIFVALAAAFFCAFVCVRTVG